MDNQKSMWFCGVMTNALADRITKACAATRPKSKERAEALKSIRWQLASPMGLRAGMDGMANLILLPTGHKNVQTLDGRDNEATKLAFYSRFLGPLTVELL